MGTLLNSSLLFSGLVNASMHYLHVLVYHTSEQVLSISEHLLDQDQRWCTLLYPNLLFDFPDKNFNTILVTEMTVLQV